MLLPVLGAEAAEAAAATEKEEEDEEDVEEAAEDVVPPVAGVLDAEPEGAAAGDLR